MKNVYSDAIDLLMSGDVDFRQVTISLAKENPDLFLRLAGKQLVEPWCQEVIKYLRNNQKIDAIKQIRVVTGLGLKEAKDISDNLQHSLHVRWPFEYPEPNYSACPLDGEPQRIYSKIWQAVA